MNDASLNLKKHESRQKLEAIVEEVRQWMTREELADKVISSAVFGDKDGCKYVIRRIGMTIVGSMNYDRGIVEVKAGIPEAEWLREHGYAEQYERA